MKILLPIFILIIFLGCGDPATDEITEENQEATTTAAGEEEAYVLPEADYYLTVSDSIGVELGDSNYVFGAIVGLDFASNGDMAILDMQKSAVSIFSPTGEFIQRVGRNGSAPGEFLLPAGMSFTPEGGLIVSDGMAHKIVYFDENYELITEAVGFIPSPPAPIVALEGYDIIGMKPDFDQTEDGMFMGFTVARWNMDSSEPTQVFYEQMSPFDPTDLSAMTDDIVSFAATKDGRVFTAPVSSENYMFTAFAADGAELYTYEQEDFERVPKTQSEIDLEIEIVNSRMIAQGMPPSMANWEPNPYRIGIASMFIDGYDRLWITKGTTKTATFDVYSLDGDLLFTAALDVGERADTWTLAIGENGFACFDIDPEYYPQLYFGSLPVQEQDQGNTQN